MDKGDIKIVGEQYTDGWSPEVAQKNMEQILTKNNNKVDAVVASNDGTAGGVVAALRAQNMVGVPVSGQDGDVAALNRVARGEQTVSVWKDARELGKAAGTFAARWRRARSSRDLKEATVVERRSQEARDPVGVPEAGADHAGQPQGRDRRGLGHQGAGLRRRGAAKAPAACK